MAQALGNGQKFTAADQLFLVFQQISPVINSRGTVNTLGEGKIEELMVAELKINEIFQIEDSVKYSSLHCLMRFLTLNPDFPISHLDLVLLLCFRIGMKVHKSEEQASKFNLNSLLSASGVNPPEAHEYNLETDFLVKIQFDLCFETPFDLLQLFLKEQSLPSNFLNAIRSYINFCMTIKEFAERSSCEIFLACLLACYQTMSLKPRGLESRIKSIIAENPETPEFSTQIVRKLEEILENVDNNSQGSTISI